jgi:site-specific DNA recombinase
MPDTRRCILYARKSTDREDMQILSIPAQLTELRRFAERSGLAVTEELTESCSAREPGRPVFSRLLQDIAAGRIERLLAWKLDRLARNPIDGGALIHYLGKGLLKELVTPEGTFTGAGDSKFMLSVLFGAATKMTDDLSQGVRRGNRAVHERGRINGPPPLGYIKVRDQPGFRGAGKCMPDPERFEILRRAWRHVLAGETPSEVYRKATQSWGLTTRGTRNNPSRVPSLNYFFNILGNRFYAGQIVRWGEVFPGEHESMLSVAEFERIQQVIHRRDAPRPCRHHFLYTGLLRCGACGRLLVGELIKERYTYYRCARRREGRERCAEPGPTEAQVTSDIENAIATVTLDRETASWTLEALDCWFGQETDDIDAALRAKKSEVENLDRQLRRLTDLALAGHIDDSEYVSRKGLLVERRAELVRAIEDPIAEQEARRSDVTNLISGSTLFLDAFRTGSQDDRRALIRRLYENCAVANRITTPALRFPFSLLAERRPNPEGGVEGDENFPSPSETITSIRRNARPRSRRERAFQAWCTKLIALRMDRAVLNPTDRTESGRRMSGCTHPRDGEDSSALSSSERSLRYTCYPCESAY